MSHDQVWFFIRSFCVGRPNDIQENPMLYREIQWYPGRSTIGLPVYGISWASGYKWLNVFVKFHKASYFNSHFILLPANQTIFSSLQLKRLVGKQVCHEPNKPVSCVAVTESFLFTAAYDYTIACWNIKARSLLITSCRI